MRLVIKELGVLNYEALTQDALSDIEARFGIGQEVLIDFIERMWQEARTRYRDLPWRHINDAYGVMVSEIMLQQTQVTRVLRYWDAWMQQFPTLDALASASRSDVLQAWQGLGYNRRALALYATAQECSAKYRGELPASYDELLSLPGIGPATAAGICSFAYEKPSVYIETNVRSIFIHEFFAEEERKITDKLLSPLVRACCPDTHVRDWYYGLLDYGSYLKTITVNPNRKSAHYTRQSKFEGSHRQKRSFIVRLVLACDGGVAVREVFEKLCKAEQEAGRNALTFEQFQALIQELEHEQFLTCEGDMLHCS